MVERKPAESLTQKLFRRRVALLAGLDARLPAAGPLGAEEQALRTATADLLHRIVDRMNLDNFVVRRQRRWVEQYRERPAWDRLDGEQAAELADRLSGLPSAERDDDEGAKRFDLLILRAQLCVLTGEAGLLQIGERVREIAEALLGQTGVPAIQEQAALLEALTDVQWWEDVTLPMLEEARVRVRGLVRLIERSKRRKVYTDFPDELGELSELPVLPGSGQVNAERFREKVRAFLRDHEDHIAIHKLRRNVPLTAGDLAELERILVESGGFERERLERKVEKADGSLGVFVRSLVGLDRAAAKEALSGFLHGSTFTAAQIKFVELIVEYLTRNGVVAPRQLYESPFTEIAPRGPDAFFGEHFVQLETALDEIHQRAAVAS